MNKFLRTGAGLHRKTWLIRGWLDSQGLNLTKVAKKLKVSNALVSRTISGVDNNRRVLRYLRDLKCPLDFLSLPEDLRTPICKR